MGPGNVGLGLFTQVQNIQVKCRKKALKKAKMVSKILALTHLE